MTGNRGPFFVLKGSTCNDCGTTMVADRGHPDMEDKDPGETLGIACCPECEDLELEPGWDE